MKMQLPIIIFALLWLPISMLGQVNIENTESPALIKEGISFHDQGKFEEAIDLYSKVALNDTNYTLSQYETALSYFELKEFKKAQKILEEVLKLDLLYNKKNEIYSLLGSAYDENKEWDQAVNVFSEGLRFFPKSYLLYYNRGMVQAKLGKHQLAMEDFKSAITCKSSHVGSHYNLGMYAMHEGHYTEAILSFITCLILEPNTYRAREIIGTLENVANGEFEEVSKNFAWKENDDFEQMNVFVHNKVALEKAYKANLTIDVAYGKQLHFLLANIKYDVENSGFWNQTYVPLYLDIFQNGKFDELILYSLQAASSDKIAAKLKAKKSKLDDFLKYAQSKWTDYASMKYIPFEEKKQLVHVNYGTNGITSMGVVKGSLPVGNWFYYYPNGSLEMKANYSDKGTKQNVWETFNEYNGKIKSKMTFANDKLNGEVTFYYLYGELKERKSFVDGVLEDTLYTYYRSGDLYEKCAIKKGLKNGEIFGYHENGQLNYVYSFKDGVPDGPYKSYFSNGRLSREFGLVANNYEGQYISYHENGQMKVRVKYANDLKQGLEEVWYSSGQLEEKSNFKDGKQVSVFEQYYSNGVVSFSGVLDETGKQNGIVTNFDLDGKKYLEQVYKKGQLIEVKSYNKNGEEFSKTEIKGKKLPYKIYYPDGTLKTEGLYEENERQGEWKYYDRYTNISAVEHFEKGNLIDTAKYYYANGQLKSLETYSEGMLNGLYLHYSIFGNLIQEGKYKNGNYDKDWYEYNEDGLLISEQYYIEGELHGIQKEYDVVGKMSTWKVYEYGRVISQNFLDTLGNKIDQYAEMHGEVKLHDASGQYIRYSAHYRNGLSDGVSKWFGPDNNLETQGNFINNRRDGLWQYYYPNGKIRKQMTYINGALFGESKRYSKEGVVLAFSNFVDDQREGLDYDYYSTGKVSVETNFLNGEKHGKETYFETNGTVNMIRYYDLGILKSYSYLGENGKEVTPIELKKGTNKIVTYYPNGKKASEHIRINGLIEGHYIVYTTTGSVFSDEVFKNGVLHGESVFYYPSGAKQIAKIFQFGDYHGQTMEYFENGKIKSLANYLYDTSHGLSVEYSEEGEILTKTLYYNDEPIRVTVPIK